MSLDSQPVLGMSAEALPAAAPVKQGHPILSACYALVALAAGFTLAIFPWVDTWNFNYLQGISPTLEYLWDEPAFRGTLTALGLLNVLIGLHELAVLFRTGRRSGPR